MIYLDHAATTACAPEVIEAMLPFFGDTFANAASVDHKPGNDARIAVEAAREAVASLVGANAEDVIFTSGATEANNLALSFSSRVLTTKVEHPSVLDTFVSRRGTEDAFIRTDERGLVDNPSLENLLSASTDTLVSVIATNNEIGVEQDVRSIAKLVSKSKAMLHLDATQAVGTSVLDLKGTPGLVGISISGHKINGPKGVGALIASSTYRRRLRAIQHGGGHERGLRSGTLNVPAIVGFGVAAKLTKSGLQGNRAILGRLREAFVERLRAELGERVAETVRDAGVSPHVLSLRFTGTNGRALLRVLRDDVAFSLGSACATNKTEPSHVLLALGLEKRAIAETVRFSFSPTQDLETIVRAAARIAEAVSELADFSLTA